MPRRVQSDAVTRAAVALCLAVMDRASVSVDDIRPVRASRPKPARVAAPVAAVVTPAPAAVVVSAPVSAPVPVAVPAAAVVKPAARVPAMPPRAPVPRNARTIVPPRIDTQAMRPQGEMVVPAGVKVTVCPSGVDTRFTVDAAFDGGEMLAEWRRLRGGR